MIRIRLGDQDRERYGVPEWIEYDPNRPTLAEVRAVREQTSFKGWVELEKNLDSADLDDRFAAAGVIYWLAVRRAGVEVTWADFGLDGFFDVRTERAEDPNQQAPTSGA